MSKKSGYVDALLSPEGILTVLVRSDEGEARTTSRNTQEGRWRLIAALLHDEGYEIVPDLFEHSIRRRTI